MSIIPSLPNDNETSALTEWNNKGRGEKMSNLLRATVVSLASLCVLLMFHGEAQAKLTNTVVTKILVAFDNNIQVTFADTVRDSGSTCRGDIVNQLALQANTEAGKAQLSALIAAKMSGKRVTVAGRVTACDSANIEQLAWVRIED